MRNALYKIINIIVAMIAVLCIISVSVTAVILVRPVYYWDIERLDIDETSGYSKEVCKNNYDALIDYNLIGGPSELNFPTFDMSFEGKVHFSDVKKIFITMQVIALTGVILLPCFLLYLKQWGASRNKTLWMRITGVLLLVIAAVVGGAIVVDWQWTFTFMHELFFSNDYWIFDPMTDPVINILPDRYFMHCGIIIAVLVTVMAVLLEIGYRRVNRHDGNHI